MWRLKSIVVGLAGPGGRDCALVTRLTVAESATTTPRKRNVAQVMGFRVVILPQADVP